MRFRPPQPRWQPSDLKRKMQSRSPACSIWQLTGSAKQELVQLNNLQLKIDFELSMCFSQYNLVNDVICAFNPNVACNSQPLYINRLLFLCKLRVADSGFSGSPFAIFAKSVRSQTCRCAAERTECSRVTCVGRINLLATSRDAILNLRV
jgi:hypothetical protein